MPIQTHKKISKTEDAEMYRVILETGEIMEFKQVKTAIRKKVEINGEKQILCIAQNAGFGPDVNAILFDDVFEYGNLAPDEVKHVMWKLATEKALDLSNIHIINGKNCNRIVQDQAYLLDVTVLDDIGISDFDRENVFIINENLHKMKYCRPNNSYVELGSGFCDEDFDFDLDDYNL